MTNIYFHKYLKIAPFSLALWRGVEAQKIKDAYELIRKDLINGKKIKSQSIFKRPLLDLGCGFGEFAGVFFDSKVEVGIDINIEDLILAKKNNSYKKLHVADARNLPFQQRKFSTVISVSVLEHIPHPQKAIEESYRVLKKQGIFVYTVPTSELNDHLFYPELCQKMGMQRLRSFYLTYYHRAFKHINMYPVKKWHAMTEKAGFTILYSKGTFSRNLTLFFDFFLLTALPSQISRWLFNERWVWGLPVKQRVLDPFFNYLLAQKVMTESNILIIAQKQ